VYIDSSRTEGSSSVNRIEDSSKGASSVCRVKAPRAGRTRIKGSSKVQAPHIE